MKEDTTGKEQEKMKPRRKGLATPARRAQELQTQIKKAFLERENMRMLVELMAVPQENVCLRIVLSSNTVTLSLCHLSGGGS